MIFNFIDILNFLGIVAFAVSGTLAAIEKRLDFFGVLTIALVTSIGGGTLRDVLIGNTPVSWLLNLNTFYIIVGSSILATIFRQRLRIFRTSLFLFDTIGIGLFTLVGLEKGVEINLHPFICISLGTITACFGGVLRDILCNEIPVIFRKEIYATACIVGGFVFFGLRYLNLNDDLIYLLTAATVIVIRILAVVKKWSFPPIEMK
ncbi:trimeric intracellular cation channel family protein [Flavobacterium sp. I3-2]|uniref:trimeric intracellular cation channel family protein n=1 Tax=Flavobacterium sp. I3-2 TaxID=2748319 RepID=UPI0039777635